MLVADAVDYTVDLKIFGDACLFSNVTGFLVKCVVFNAGIS